MPLEILKSPPKLAHGPRTKPQTLPPSLLRDIFEGLVDIGMGATGFGNDTKMSGIGELVAAALPVGALGMALKSGSRVHKVVNASQAPYKTGAHTVHNIKRLSQTPAIDSYKQFVKQGLSHDEAIKAAGKGYANAGGPTMEANLDNLFSRGFKNAQRYPSSKPKLNLHNNSLTGSPGKVHKYSFDNSPKGTPPSQTGRFDKANLKASDFPSQNRLAMGMNPSGGTYDEAGRYVGAASKVDPVFQAHVASSRGKHKLGGPLRSQNMEETFLGKGESGPSPSQEMIRELVRKYAAKR